MSTSCPQKKFAGDGISSSIDVVVNEMCPEDIDRVLSKEMESLSFPDRNKIQEEIHGVTNLCPEETPAMIRSSLQSMQQRIIHIQQKPIYDLIPPSSYVHSKEFMLSFLRCELFDCKKAAERLIRYTEYMEEEYDMEVLERPLQITDLQRKLGKKGKAVMDSFKVGHTQLLPFRDRSGRRIFTSHFVALTFEPFIRYKIYQYLLLVAARDEDTQKNGVVGIFWGKESNMPLPDNQDHIKARRLLDSIPVRVASIHQSFENTPVLQLLRAVIVLMMRGGGNTMRVQTHLEDDWEIRYKLLGYGIPVDLLPYTETNKMKTKNLYLWMKGRKSIEHLEGEKRANNDDTPLCLVECPALADVVFKTGTSNVSHPGNSVFRDMLQRYYTEYHSTRAHSVKQAVVSQIMENVFERRGKFLEWSNKFSCWVVIQDHGQVSTKICNSLFHFQKLSKAKVNVQTNSSSTYIFERQDGRKRKRAMDGTEISCCNHGSGPLR